MAYDILEPETKGYEVLEPESQDAFRGPTENELAFGDKISRAGMGLQPVIPSNDFLGTEQVKQQKLAEFQKAAEAKSDASPEWLGKTLGVIGNQGAQIAEGLSDPYNIPNRLINDIAGRPVVAELKAANLEGLVQQPAEMILELSGLAKYFPETAQVTKDLVSGAGQGIEEVASGFTDPKMAAALPVFGAGPQLAAFKTAAKAWMAGNAIKGVPDSIQEFKRVVEDPESTGKDIAREAAKVAAGGYIAAKMTEAVPSALPKVIAAGKQPALAAPEATPKAIPKQQPQEVKPMETVVKAEELAKPEKPAATKYNHESGWVAVVSKEPAAGQPGDFGTVKKPWRVSYFDKSGEAKGHRGFDTQAEAESGIGNVLEGMPAPREGWKQEKVSESVKGGAESELSPEAQAKSRENNSLRKMAEANDVEFVEGDTPTTILEKINAKKPAAPQPTPTPAEPSAKGGVGPGEIHAIGEPADKFGAVYGPNIGKPGYEKLRAESESFEPQILPSDNPNITHTLEIRNGKLWLTT